MFLVDQEKNMAMSLHKKTFQELKFQERKHLQEWISKNPDILGESLLIIQKEFAGFDDTRERLDLLALDRSVNLVVIENKLDDSGRDVVWQVLKYASYCSRFTKTDIKDIFQSYLITGSFARIELSIYSNSQEETKEIFDSIFTYKDQIEASFGHELDWQRRDGGEGSRIAYWLRDVSVFNPDDWSRMINFLITNMINFEKAVSEVLYEIRKKRSIH